MTKRYGIAAAIALLVAAAGPALAASGNSTSKVQTADCINATTGLKEGTFTYNGPDMSWPPNHKYVALTITLTDEDAEPATDEATVTVTGTHDQYLADGTEMNGAGNTDDDVVVGAPGKGTPTATTTAQFRSERSGHKGTGEDPWAGRTYTFTANGTTDNGTATCQPVQFTATVPHDQGNHGTKD